MSVFRNQMRYLTPYDIHKLLINHYLLKKPGDTKLLKGDTSKGVTDVDVLKNNHKFLWDNDPHTWEEQFAKKYYDKLYKEYCIGDFSLYKDNKIALRWRIEKEVILGKGHFICGNKICEEKDELKTWEVNFTYREEGKIKNALIKIRLCPSCSNKLNYHSKKREIKKDKKRKHKEDNYKKNKKKSIQKEILDNEQPIPSCSTQIKESDEEQSAWSNLKPEEIKSRDEEMEEYLEGLLL